VNRIVTSDTHPLSPLPELVGSMVAVLLCTVTPLAKP